MPISASDVIFYLLCLNFTKFYSKGSVSYYYALMSYLKNGVRNKNEVLFDSGGKLFRYFPNSTS